MSIESTNIYDLLSADNEGVALPAKTPAKDSKVETKAAAPKHAKEAEKKPELGKGKKTEDKPKRTAAKAGGGGDRPPREKPANPNKRVFDRRSGTGRGKEQKKGGAGKGNWGSIEPSEELAAEAQPVEEAPKEPAEIEEKAAPAEGTPAPTDAPAEEKPAEEEDKTLSYEEWKAKNETKSLELPVPIRQAGEGVDDSAWASYVPLSREAEETAKSGEKSGEKKKKEAANSGKLRVDEVFKIQTEEKKPFRARPNGPKRTPGPRGDNKNFRGGGRGRPKNFSLNDEAFPSLTTKA